MYTYYIYIRVCIVDVVSMCAQISTRVQQDRVGTSAIVCVCASRPRQGGVLSHPTWRFQFHFLSRRSPLAPAPLTPHLRPPCCTDLGPGVVSHPTPYYSLHVARGCKDRDPLLLSRSAPSILRLLLHSKLKVEFTNVSSVCDRYGRTMFQTIRCFNFTGILSLTFVFNYHRKFTWK